MKKVISLSVFFLLISLYSFSQSEIKEGEWEITIKMQMEGLNFDLPATKVKQCIKKENPIPMEPMEKGKKPDCKMLKQEIKGNTVSYEMECKESGNKILTKGTMTYKENTFEGKTTVKITGKEEQEFTQIMTGKYLGPCK